MGQFENFRNGRACRLLVVVKRLKPLMALRLASSVSDHTPVLFNVFEDWNEESVILVLLHTQSWQIFTDLQSYKHNTQLSCGRPALLQCTN